jgi:hypothetical protein
MGHGVLLVGGTISSSTTDLDLVLDRITSFPPFRTLFSPCRQRRTDTMPNRTIVANVRRTDTRPITFLPAILLSKSQNPNPKSKSSEP